MCLKKIQVLSYIIYKQQFNKLTHKLSINIQIFDPNKHFIMCNLNNKIKSILSKNIH